MKIEGMESQTFEIESNDSIGSIPAESIQAQSSLELFFTLSPTTLNALQVHAADNAEPMQAVVEQAVKAWIAARPEPSKTSN